MSNENRQPADVPLQREMRVDQAHPVARPEVPAAAPQLVAARAVHSEAEPADEFNVAALFSAGLPPEALERHATELAEKLQSRLVELDHREATLNVQEAELENRMRSARLWLEERECELDAREEAVEQRESTAGDFDDTTNRELSASRSLEVDDRERQLLKIQAETEHIQDELAEKLNELDIQTAYYKSKQDELTASRQQFEMRQRELDSREAELYKQLEQLTTTEVSLQQRVEKINAAEAEITKRQLELHSWELKIGERGSELEFQRAEINRIHQEVEFRLRDADERERRIRFREQEIKMALQRFERLNITEQKMVELQHLASEYETREASLAAAESLMAEQQVQLAQQSYELEQQELAFEKHVSRQRTLISKEKEEHGILLSRREQLLDQREAEIEQRGAALEQLQEELRAAQREVLEIRLATEETWLQLQGVLAPATLSRSISQLRVKLADHFHLAAEEALCRRRELEKVRQELALELDHLQSQRQDLENWLNRREQDLEQRAATLVSRELELDAQQRHYELAEKKWQTKQAEYQRDIQRLLARERTEVSAAA